MTIVVSAPARRHIATFDETWGHLAPSLRQVYAGSFLYAVSCFDSGSASVIDFDFGDLDGSPWFYDGIHEYIFDAMKNRADRSEPGVYQFVGRCWLDGTVRFSGVIRPVPVTIQP